MSTETVSLNLDGNFAPAANDAAAAAVKLGAGLDKVSTSAASVKFPPMVSEEARLKMIAREAEAAAKAYQKLKDARTAASVKAGGLEGADKEAFGWLNKLPNALQQSGPQFSGFQKLVAGVEKMFGSNAAAGLVKGAAAAAEFSEKHAGAIKAASSALSTGGGVVAGAAVVLGAAAAALGYAAVKIGAAAVHFGIEQTSLREGLENSLGKGGYQVLIKIAGQYGIENIDEARKQVGGLLAAKFSEAEIPVIMRIAVGIGALRGEEKAKAFVEKMETAANKGGKANEEVIKSFAEAGVNVDDVWKTLAQKLGVSVAQAQAKVKTGAVSMKDALDAVEKAAGAQFGAAADKLGKSVPALLARIKLGFAQLFSGFDLGPLKGALENVAKVIEGPGGKKLFDAISRFGTAAIKTLFGPFEGPEGAAKLERFANGAANVIGHATDAIERAAPIVERFVDLLDNLFGRAPEGEQESGWSKTIKGIALAIGSFNFGDALNMARAMLLITDAILGTDLSAGYDIGLDFVSGIASGIADGAGSVIAAATGIADQLLATVKGALGIASPSKEAMAIMGHFGDGMVKGAQNDNGASQAGATVADDLTGATRGGLAGGAGGGGGVGGGGLTVIQYFPPGTPEETRAAAKMGVEEAYAEWQRHARRAGREAGERAA